MFLRHFYLKMSLKHFIKSFVNWGYCCISFSLTNTRTYTHRKTQRKKEKKKGILNIFHKDLCWYFIEYCEWCSWLFQIPSKTSCHFSFLFLVFFAIRRVVLLCDWLDVWMIIIWSDELIIPNDKQMKVSLGEIDVPQMIETVLSTIKSKAQHKNIHISSSCSVTSCKRFTFQHIVKDWDLTHRDKNCEKKMKRNEQLIEWENKKRQREKNTKCIEWMCIFWTFGWFKFCFVVILADQVRIGQVLINFISNAVKFTPENGDVIITADLQVEMRCLWR